MREPTRSRKPSPNEADKPQIDRFREAARELGCDESEERFDAALVKVAKAGAPPKAEKARHEEPDAD